MTNYTAAQLGCKTLQTTGSISKNSNSLTLTSNPGFQVGDHIIVEVGGETTDTSSWPHAGIGSDGVTVGGRGTRGVGGYWPPAPWRYASVAALNAAGLSKSIQFAYVTDGTYNQKTRAWGDDGTGTNTFVWQDSITGPAFHPGAFYDWYDNEVTPYSLIAQITAIGGTGNTTLTLNTTAQATTSNANVYFDNYYMITAGANADVSLGETDPGSVVPGLGSALGNSPTITFGAGTYAFSGPISFGSWSPSSGGNVTIAGSGVGNTTLKVPKGLATPIIRFGSCTGVTVRDLTCVYNYRNNGFTRVGGSTYGGYAQPYWGPGAFDSSSAGGLIWFTGCHDCNVYRVNVVDPANCAFDIIQSSNIWTYNCDVTISDPLRSYAGGWVWDFVYATLCGACDCHVYSNYLFPSFEFFGGDRCSTIRCGGLNAQMSINGSGLCTIDNPRIVVTSMSLNCSWVDPAQTFGFVVPQPVGPTINYAANAGGVSSYEYGHTLRNPNILYLGYQDNASQSAIIDSYLTNASQPQLLGTYNDVVPGISYNGQGPCVVLADYYATHIGGSGPAIVTNTSSAVDDILNDPGRNTGVIEMPDWIAPSRAHGAEAVAGDGFNLISGMRVKGSTVNNYNWPYDQNIALYNGGLVINCIADNIAVQATTVKIPETPNGNGTGVAVNCYTNANWPGN